MAWTGTVEPTAIRALKRRRLNMKTPIERRPRVTVKTAETGDQASTEWTRTALSRTGGRQRRGVISDMTQGPSRPRTKTMGRVEVGKKKKEEEEEMKIGRRR